MTAQQSQLLSELRTKLGELLLLLSSMELIDGIHEGGWFRAGKFLVMKAARLIERAIRGIESAREVRRAA